MIIPFLNFEGRCKEVIEYYETVFTVDNKNVVFYKDAPEFGVDKRFDDYVLHAQMNIEGTQVWLGDSFGKMQVGDYVTLALQVKDAQTVTTIFNKLKEKGNVLMDVTPTDYSPLFGTVQDKFGIIWHIIC